MPDTKRYGVGRNRILEGNTQQENKEKGKMGKKECITLLAVGDVFVDREEPDSIFTYVAPVIKSADIRFCQLEAVYSERGAPQAHCRVPLKAHPRNAPAIQRAGFQIASFACNHSMDWGYQQ